MDIFSWMIIGVVVLSAAIGLVAVQFSRRAETKFKETLTSVLGAPDFQWDSQQNTFRHQGLSFRYERYQGSKNSPPSFSVGVICQATGGEFELYPEGGLHRFFKNLSLSREVQTGDDAFDSRVYIASDKPGFAAECFRSAEKREAARRLFDLKASSITHSGGRLIVKWNGHNSHNDGVAALRDAMAVLAILAKDLPLCQDVPQETGTGIRSPFAIRLCVYIAAAAVLGAGILSVIYVSTNYEVFDVWGLFVFSLKFSLPALGVFLYFSVASLAGQSRSYRDISVAVFLVFIGFPLFGAGFTALYNGMADRAPVTSRMLLITDKQINKSGDSPSYGLLVPSWRRGHGYEYLETNCVLYRKVVPGKDHAVVLTKPGRLGFEWKLGMRVIPENIPEMDASQKT
jgi:hypothetical protein